MASLANINVRFSVDLSQFSTEMQNSLRTIDKVGQKFQAVGRNMSAFVTLPILAAGAAAVKFASDYNESLNKVDVSFKNSSQTVKDFSKTTLESFGIAEGTALDMASGYGDMATSMGLTTGEAAKMSTSLVGLAGDLASFKNISIDIANTAITGIFTGETESLKRMGIVMTEVNLKAFALSSGIQTQYEQMSQAEKVQLRYNYILSVTKNSQGDFARTQGGAANQMRIFQESLKQVGAQLGAVVLPLFTKIISAVNQKITAFSNLSESTKKIIVVTASLVAVVGPLAVAIGVVLAAIPAMVAGFTTLSAAIGLSLGPITLIIAGLAAVAYVVVTNWTPIKKILVDIANYFVDLYNNSTVFRGAIEYITVVFKNMWAVMKLTFTSILDAVDFVGKRIYSVFKNAGNLIKSVLTLDFNGIKNALGTGFKELGTETFAFFKKLAENTKKSSLEVADNVVTAFNNTINKSKIEKLTIPVEVKKPNEAETAAEIIKKAEAKARLEAKAEAEARAKAEAEAAKEKGVKKNSLSGLDSNLGTTVSAGTIESYDEEIKKLIEFRDTVATTPELAKKANDSIAQLEFAKDLILTPEKVIEITGGFDNLVTQMSAKAAGLKAVSDSMKTVFIDLSDVVNQAIEQLAENALAGFGEAIGGLLSGTSNLSGVLNGMLGLIGGFMQSLGKALIAAGVASDAFKKLFAKPYLAIAAGVALVALGSIVQSQLSKGPQAQAFANGGIVAGGSMYGDKILARVNSGELILNNKQQKAVYGAMNSASTAVNVTLGGGFVLDGNKLRLVLDRTDKRNSRTS